MNIGFEEEEQDFDDGFFGGDDGFYGGDYGIHLLFIEFRLTILDSINGDNISESDQKTASTDLDDFQEEECIIVDQGNMVPDILI